MVKLLVILIPLLIFLPTINYQLVWDDFDFLTNWNQSHSIGEFPALISGSQPPGHEGTFRPVRSVAYLISYLLSNGNPQYYHFQAIVIHLLNTFLIYLLCLCLTGKSFQSSVTSLLFSLHPLRTESVAWITGSFDALGVSFLLMTLLGFVKNQRVTKPVLITSLLALLSYELTYTLPILLLLIAHLHFKLSIHKSFSITKHIWFLFFLVFFIRAFATSSAPTWPYVFDSIPLNLFLAIVLTGFSILKIILPSPSYLWYPITGNISNLYHHDFNFTKPATIADITTIPTIVFVLTTISVFVLSLKTAKSHPTISLGLLIMILGLSPVVGLIPQPFLYADRYLLVSSVGFSILIAALLPKPSTKTMMFSVILLSLTIIPLQKSLPQFSSNFGFWQTNYQHQSQSSLIANNYATALYDKGDISSSLSVLETVLSYNPNYPLSQELIIKIYQQTNQPELALGHALYLNQLEPHNLSNLSAAYQLARQLNSPYQHTLYNQLLSHQHQ